MTRAAARAAARAGSARPPRARARGGRAAAARRVAAHAALTSARRRLGGSRAWRSASSCPANGRDRQVDDVRDQRRQALRPPGGDLVEDQQLGAAEGEAGAQVLARRRPCPLPDRFQRGHGASARSGRPGRGSTPTTSPLRTSASSGSAASSSSPATRRRGGSPRRASRSPTAAAGEGRRDPVDALGDGGVEAVALVGEELVEGRAGDRGAGDEVGDRRPRVGLLGAAGDHRVEDPARAAKGASGR